MKIIETNSYFYEKINKIDNLLARLTKEKREMTQITNIRNKMGYHSEDFKRIIKKFCKHLSPQKLTTYIKMKHVYKNINYHIFFNMKEIFGLDLHILRKLN